MEHPEETPGSPPAGDSGTTAPSGAPHASAPDAAATPESTEAPSVGPFVNGGGEASPSDALGHGATDGDASSDAASPGTSTVDQEMAERAAKADEYLELARRTKADFDNFRKRAMRDAAAAQERGYVKLAKELLPAIDNLDRALTHSDASGGEGVDENLIAGVKLVHADLVGALQRVGIEPYSPEGAPFDPQLHEAMAQAPAGEHVQPGTVVEVYQRGYRLGEIVLRPARVVVAG